MLLIFRLTSVVLALGAYELAMQGEHIWIWFLCAAVVLVVSDNSVSSAAFAEAAARRRNQAE